MIDKQRSLRYTHTNYLSYDRQDLKDIRKIAG